ncbi:MAG TPA: FAD-binding domain-containing protein [Solirubrobacteraceae bacterium]|nr:FAD-binding domain-containing protein [Solirubrobacteraceae bacterium]
MSLPGLLPLPPGGDVEATTAWVAEHLGHLSLEGADGAVASPRFRGGQSAADAVLASLDIRGYANQRNQVLPESRRGATAVSPYVRHGLIGLRELWDHVGDAPARDRDKYRDELLWQEYSRHLYARLGPATAHPLRREVAPAPARWPQPWPAEMACMAATVGELERDGWLVNQTRMWLSSQWSLRAGHDWRAGEDVFFTHLLDGSRAANRLGWQWTVGTGTGRPYGFSRWQVEKRAAELCRGCALSARCPIEDWPPEQAGPGVEGDPRLGADVDLAATRGPGEPVILAEPELVWLTAESLGDTDPALAAHPERPAVFVFDVALLERVRLSTKRLIFLAETLADLAARRELHIALGRPVEVLAGRRLAVTFAPVPGFRRRSRLLGPVALHPWPWLSRPHAGSLASFSAWRRKLRVP